MDMDLILDVGQANEFKLGCGRAGYTDADIIRMCKGDMLARLLPVLRGHAEVKVIKHVIDCDVDPLTFDDWKVEEHKKGGQFVWDPSKIALYVSDSQWKYDVHGTQVYVDGFKLRQEVVQRPVLNANVLDYLLWHPHLIPDEWKASKRGNTHQIYFWGTIYKCSPARSRGNGTIMVRGLTFSSGHWCPCYEHVMGDWHARRGERCSAQVML